MSIYCTSQAIISYLPNSFVYEELFISQKSYDIIHHNNRSRLPNLYLFNLFTDAHDEYLLRFVGY